MKKSVKWILLGVAVLAGLMVLAKFVRKGDDDGLKITAEKVARRTIVETVNASGKIYPEVEVKVSPDISGEIVELNVAEGDSVRKGQVLARIYADVYSSQRDEAAARLAQSRAAEANNRASIDALKAQLDQDRQTFDRNRQLFEEKVISRAELEGYETKYRASQAQYNAALQGIRGQQAGVQGAATQLNAANKNLGRATIVAPMNGVISLLNVKKGERVVGTAQMAGTEMMRVADMSGLEVRVEVGENDIVKVSIGDSADVEVDAYNNRKFQGVVTQIASSTTGSGIASAAASNDVTNYEVHIRLDPSSYADLIDPARPKKFPFRPGMNASADIKTKTKADVLSVPITAVAARVKGSDDSIDDKKKEVKKEGGEEGEEQEAETVAATDLEEVVFVLKGDGKVEKRIVKTGIQNINHIEILSGLAAGEEVVTGPYGAISKTLRSGTKVVKTDKEKLFQK